ERPQLSVGIYAYRQEVSKQRGSQFECRPISLLRPINRRIHRIEDAGDGGLLVHVWLRHKQAPVKNIIGNTLAPRRSFHSSRCSPPHIMRTDNVIEVTRMSVLTGRQNNEFGGTQPRVPRQSFDERNFSILWAGSNFCEKSVVRLKAREARPFQF